MTTWVRRDVPAIADWPIKIRRDTPAIADRPLPPGCRLRPSDLLWGITSGLGPLFLLTFLLGETEMSPLTRARGPSLDSHKIDSHNPYRNTWRPPEHSCGMPSISFSRTANCNSPRGHHGKARRTHDCMLHTRIQHSSAYGRWDHRGHKSLARLGHHRRELLLQPALAPAVPRLSRELGSLRSTLEGVMRRVSAIDGNVRTLSAANNKIMSQLFETEGQFDKAAGIIQGVQQINEAPQQPRWVRGLPDRSHSPPGRAQLLRK